MREVPGFQKAMPRHGKHIQRKRVELITNKHEEGSFLHYIVQGLYTK
jgi:hypothetical protein